MAAVAAAEVRVAPSRRATPSRADPAHASRRRRSTSCCCCDRRSSGSSRRSGCFLTSLLRAGALQRERLVEGLSASRAWRRWTTTRSSGTTTSITHSLVTTRRDRDRRHGAADPRRRARRLRVRVARVPRPRLALHRRHRPARRAAADGADPDLLALQHASGSSTPCSAWSCSTPRSGCRSRSSCCGTSSSGSRRTSSSRRGSTAPRSCASSSRLILPLGLPAIASLAIFQFLWTWNDLLVALTFGRDTQPITVAIFSQLRQFGSNIELIAPASFVSLVDPAGRVLRVPALLRAGPAGGLGEVSVAIVGSGLAGFTAYVTLRWGGLEPQ